MNSFIHARVSYHDTNKDPVLLKFVAPVLDGDDTGVRRRCVLQRHWRGGPHVSAFFESRGDDSDTRLTELLHERAEILFRESPSTRVIDEQEARRVHAALSPLEAGPVEFLPLIRDNSISIERRDPDFAYLPNPEARQLALATACNATGLVLDLVRASYLNRELRMTLCFRMALVYAHRIAGLPGGYLFARTYWEKSVALLSNDFVAANARFEAAYVRNRALLQRELDRFVQEASQEDQPFTDLLLRSWDEKLQVLLSASANLVASGIGLTVGNDEAAAIYADRGWTDTTFIEKAPVVRLLAGNRSFVESLHKDSRQQVHVFAVNQFYSLLTLVGLSGSDKLLMLFFVCRAVEEKFGIDPLKRLATAG